MYDYLRKNRAWRAAFPVKGSTKAPLKFNVAGSLGFSIKILSDPNHSQLLRSNIKYGSMNQALAI